MKAIIFELLFAGFSFLIFLVFLIIGLVKKKRNLIIISIVILFISIITGGIAIFTITKKTYNKISELSRPRTGNEIYESLLGKPEIDCVEILNFQDQTVPKIDYGIFLHFKTCPKELKRILVRKEFQFEKTVTNNLSPNHMDEDWFKPEKMGDSILIFKYYDTNGNGQEIYSSKDSTEVYLIDILD